MERQRGQRARRHNEQAALVADQRFDRRQQRGVEIVRQRQIKQPGLAGGVARLGDVESAPERGDLFRQGVSADWERLPVEAVARQRKDIAFLLGDREQHHRLIG